MLHKQEEIRVMTRTKKLSTFVRSCLCGGGIALLPLFATATEIDLTSDRAAPRERDYNIKYGPLSLALGAKLAVRYDDNITRSADSGDIEEGFNVEPALTTDLSLDIPFMPYVQVNAGVGIAYRNYPGNDGEDGLQITGEEGAATAHFDVDFRLSDTGTLTLSDTFSREIDSLDIATRAQPDDYVMSKNTVELLYNKELSALMNFKARLANTDAWTSKSRYANQDHKERSADIALLWKLNSALQLGPYVRWEEITYDIGEHNDGESREGGLAFVYQRESGFTVDGSIGIEDLSFDTTNSAATDDGVDLAFDIGASLATSEYTSHRLSASYGRSQGTLAASINYAEERTLGYSITLNFMKNVTVFANVDWVHIEESDGGETGDLLRYGLGTDYQLSPKTTVGLKIDRSDKSSDDDTREYTRNVVELNLTHKF